MSSVVVIRSPLANLTSVTGALRALDVRFDVSDDPNLIRNASHVVLPGVGAFAPAMSWLRDRGLDAAIRDASGSGTAILGICLGFQLLFERSGENGNSEGLGLLRGIVEPLWQSRTRIGWIRTCLLGSPLFANLNDDWFYYVHSWGVRDSDAAIARTEGRHSIVAAAALGRTCGVQFHPERSSTAGLQLLRNFMEWR